MGVAPSADGLSGRRGPVAHGIARRLWAGRTLNSECCWVGWAKIFIVGVELLPSRGRWALTGEWAVQTGLIIGEVQPAPGTRPRPRSRHRP
jgi:hypothetical protein